MDTELNKAQFLYLVNKTVDIGEGSKPQWLCSIECSHPELSKCEFGKVYNILHSWKLFFIQNKLRF